MGSSQRRCFSTYACLLAFTWTLWLFSTAVDARSWAAGDLPNPQHDSEDKCGRRALKSIICDPDGYLSQSDGDTIDGLANFIHDSTHGFHAATCDNANDGPQLAIAVISSMRNTFLTKDKTNAAFRFAQSLHDNWGVGNPHCQNGVVILLAVKDRAMGISVGAGLKHTLTDNMIPGIVSSLRSKLRGEEYGPALIDAVTLIGNVLSGKKDAVMNQSDPVSGVIESFFTLAFFCATFCCIVVCSGVRPLRYQSRYQDCKELLARLDDDRNRANRHEYVCKSCPICLEDFEVEAADQTTGNNSNAAEHAKTTSRSATVSLQNKGDVDSHNKASHETRTLQEDDNTETIHLMSSSSENNNAGTGASTSSATGTSTTDSKRRQTLPCGHSFHEECILSWFSTPGNSDATCPVCRQPVTAAPTPDTADTDRQGGTSTSPTDTLNSTAAEGMGWESYDNEYRFRLRRARHYYPDFITWSMIDTWQRDRHNPHRPMASSSSFVAVDPARVAAAARASGSRGSSYSFGGGSSGGGGGGGGSW